MPLYAKASLEALRQRIDLIEVVGSHIELQRKGVSYKALCPFHDEKTPSFQIQRGDSHYHCFGCGAHGDAIQFLMEHQGVTFTEAVEILAQRFGVHLELAEGGEGQSGTNKQRLREAMEQSCQLFHALLLHTPQGQEALGYLYSRGIDLDFIRHFRIGYAPSQGGVLKAFMSSHSIRQDVLQEVGLLTSGQSGRVRDFFFDRIMFPVQDGMGSVVAFSGRKFREGSGGGKYVNSPETPLFKKSKLLFGLHFSRRRIAKERKAIIVEGQIDCLRLIKEGFDYAVASQGTAFGSGHVAELLKLGVQHIFLALDADQAGCEASAKVGNLFQAEGVEVTVVALPKGSDPDSLLMNQGPDAFENLMAHGVDYLTFLVEHIGRGFDTSTPAGKNQLVRSVAKQIREWKNPVMVHESLRKLALLTQVPEEIIHTGQPTAPHLYIKGREGLGDDKALELNPDRILEADLLRWLLLVGEERDDLVQWIGSHLKGNDFRDLGCRKLYETYLTAFRESRSRDLLSLVIDAGSSEAQKLLEEAMEKRVNEAKVEEEVGETMRRILERNWMHQRDELQRRIQNGQTPDEEVLELVKEFEGVLRSPPTIHPLPEERGK